MIFRTAFLAGMLLAGAVCSGCSPDLPVSLTLVFTGRGDGTLSGCDCPGGIAGGMGRRATVFRNLRQEGKAVFFLDAGDFLSSYPNPRHDRTVLEVMAELGYDAVNAGDQDVRYGAPFLSGTGSLPLVSSMTVPDSGLPFYRNIMAGHATVRIYGITDPESFYLFPADSVPGIVVTDPLARLRRSVAKKPKDGPTVILSQIGFEADTLLARTVPGIDVIIEGHKGPETDVPIMIGRTLVVCAAAGGDRVGVLDLKYRPGRGIGAFSLTMVPLDTAVVPDPGITAYIESHTVR